MKVLPDENLPHNLLRPLSHHQVKTLDGMGWKGIKNGELMKLIEATQFDVFLTGDKNMSNQQKMTGRHVALIIMSAINWPIIKPYLSTIVQAVDSAAPKTTTFVECGKFLPYQPK